MRREVDESRHNEEENNDVFLSPLFSGKNNAEFDAQNRIHQNILKQLPPQKEKNLLSPVFDPQSHYEQSRIQLMSKDGLCIDQEEKLSFAAESDTNLPHQPNFYENVEKNSNFQSNSGEHDAFDTTPRVSFNRLPSLHAEHLSSVQNLDHCLSRKSTKTLFEQKTKVEGNTENFTKNSSSSSLSQKHDQSKDGSLDDAGETKKGFEAPVQGRAIDGLYYNQSDEEGELKNINANHNNQVNLKPEISGSDSDKQVFMRSTMPLKLVEH